MKFTPKLVSLVAAAGLGLAAIGLSQAGSAPDRVAIAVQDKGDAKPAETPKDAPAEKKEAPPEKKEAPEVEKPAEKDVVRVVPKRLGGKRLDGIRITPKPKPVTQGPTVGPQVVPPAGTGGHTADDGHGHTAGDGHGHGVPNADQAPPGRGGVAFEAGSQLQRFDDMIQGDVRDAVFTATSNGEDPLIISSVTKSCGCTRADIFLVNDDGTRTRYIIGQEIPVGQTFEIQAQIDSTGKSNLFRSDITLMTNDPRKGVVFSLEVNVKLPLVTNPRNLNLMQMKATDVKKGQVVISSEVAGAFKLAVDENIPLKNCKVELVPTEPTPDGKSSRWVVQVEVGPNMPEGTYYQSIRLVSDMPMGDRTMPDGTPMTHSVVVYATAQVLGPVAVTPPHLSFGILRPDQAAQRKATIRITDEEWSLSEAPKLSLKGYGQDFEYPEDFKASIKPLENGDWELTLDLLGLAPEGSGAFRGLVEVELGHPAKPILEVGFSGAVRAGVVRSGK